jgi:hypothetical protein
MIKQVKLAIDVNEDEHRKEFIIRYGLKQKNKHEMMDSLRVN